MCALVGRLVHSVLFESWEIVGPYGAWWLFNGLLLVLQTLHIIWFYLIARIAIKAIFKGKVSVLTFITLNCVFVVCDVVSSEFLPLGGLRLKAKITFQKPRSDQSAVSW